MKIRFNAKLDNEIVSEEVYKKRRWDRWLYFVVFLIIMTLFFKWLLSVTFYDVAEGVLLQDHNEVRFSEDIELIKYFVEEGDYVERGDTLFIYRELGVRGNGNILTDSLAYIMENNKFKANLITVRMQIKKRNTFIHELEARLRYWFAEKELKKKLAYLDVVSVGELAAIDRKIDEINYKLRAMQAETNALKKELFELEELYGSNMSLNNQMTGYQYADKVYLSAIDGRVDQLKIAENEIGYKREGITSIIRSNFYVEAFLEMDALNQFSIGDEVWVVLPFTHHKLKAVVSKAYSISARKNDVILPERIRGQNYGGVLKIIPKNEEEWESLYYSNIPVEVRKLKF